MDAEISHPLLVAQLRDHFGEEGVTDPRLLGLLSAVDRAYHESDALRDRLRRSVSLSLERLLALSSQSPGQARALDFENEIRQARELLAESVGPRASGRGARQAEACPRTILCVEDEAGLRQLITRMLSSRGYRVLEAGTATAALELAEAHSGSIDLLLCEVQLPDTTGAALRARLRPHLRGKVLYLFPGGGGGPSVEAESLLLRKPFSIEELADKVQEALFGE